MYRFLDGLWVSLSSCLGSWFVVGQDGGQDPFPGFLPSAFCPVRLLSPEGSGVGMATPSEGLFPPPPFEPESPEAELWRQHLGSVAPSHCTDVTWVSRHCHPPWCSISGALPILTDSFYCLRQVPGTCLLFLAP